MVVEVREAGGVQVLGNRSMVTSSLRVTESCAAAASEGFNVGRRPISGCCRFLFFRLIFSAACLKLLRADSQGPEEW